MTETEDIRRKRLLFRSWHRGTKEADLLLGSFAEAHLAGFSAAELDEYESLIAENDAELWEWLIGREDPPADLNGAMLRRIRAFKYTPRPA